MQLGTPWHLPHCSACTALEKAHDAGVRTWCSRPRSGTLREGYTGEHRERGRTGLVHRMGGMSKYLGASAVPRLKETEGSVCTFAQPPSTIHMPFTVFVRPGIRCAHRGQRQPAAAKVLRAGSACMAAGDLDMT
jgi:hypothetical protein